jgi:hypothetical protein
MTNNRESLFDKDVGFKRQHVPLLIMPALLLLLVTFILPTDLFSTAKWWEMQGWTLVWQPGEIANPIIIALDNMIPGTTAAEAVAFSAAMIGFQFIVTLKIYQEGSWLRSGSPIGLVPLIWKLAKSNERFENVNPSKAAWAAVWLFCVLFDAYTSYSYRSTATSSTLITLIVHAIFAENVLSEIMIGETVRGTINLFAMLAVSFRGLYGGSSSRPSKPSPQPSQRNGNQNRGNNDRPAVRDDRRSGSAGRERPQPTNGNRPLFHAPTPATMPQISFDEAVPADIEELVRNAMGDM